MFVHCDQPLLGGGASPWDQRGRSECDRGNARRFAQMEYLQIPARQRTITQHYHSTVQEKINYKEIAPLVKIEATKFCIAKKLKNTLY